MRPIYIGPKGRCVEAGAKGKVITFDIPHNQWDANLMFEQRILIDKLYGIGSPLADRALSPERMEEIRLGVANYCLQQAKDNKPYNLNFLNSEAEDAFYCSQLAYKAYIQYNIYLNTEKDIPNIFFTKSIIFPQELWAASSGKMLP